MARPMLSAALLVAVLAVAVRGQLSPPPPTAASPPPVVASPVPPHRRCRARRCCRGLSRCRGPIAGLSGSARHSRQPCAAAARGPLSTSPCSAGQPSTDATPALGSRGPRLARHLLAGPCSLLRCQWRHWLLPGHLRRCAPSPPELLPVRSGHSSPSQLLTSIQSFCRLPDVLPVLRDRSCVSPWLLGQLALHCACCYRPAASTASHDADMEALTRCYSCPAGTRFQAAGYCDTSSNVACPGGAPVSPPPTVPGTLPPPPANDTGGDHTGSGLAGHAWSLLVP